MTRSAAVPRKMHLVLLAQVLAVQLERDRASARSVNSVRSCSQQYRPCRLGRRARIWVAARAVVETAQRGHPQQVEPEVERRVRTGLRPPGRRRRSTARCSGRPPWPDPRVGCLARALQRDLEAGAGRSGSGSAPTVFRTYSDGRGGFAPPPGLFDPADHLGVQPEARAEREVPVVGLAEPDHAGPIRRCSASSSTPVASTQSLGRPSARANTLVDPPGTTAMAGVDGPGPVAQHPVGDLVDGTVAAESDHDVHAVLGGPLGEVGRVPAPLGVVDRQVDLAAQRVDQDVTTAARWWWSPCG